MGARPAKEEPSMLVSQQKDTTLCHLGQNPLRNLSFRECKCITM